MTADSINYLANEAQVIRLLCKSNLIMSPSGNLEMSPQPKKWPKVF